MRRVDPSLGDSEFDRRFQSGTGQTRIRDASWGDLSRLVALYAFPHPWFVKDYGVRVFSHPEMPLQRCVTIPISLFLRAERKPNRLLVMEDDRRTLVGAMSVYRTNPAIGAIAMDFLVLPSYMPALPSLLDEGYRIAASSGCKSVVAFVSELDRGKEEGLRRIGFEPARALEEELLPASGAVAVQIYETRL
jgi:hypothetical protein